MKEKIWFFKNEQAAREYALSQGLTESIGVWRTGDLLSPHTFLIIESIFIFRREDSPVYCRCGINCLYSDESIESEKFRVDLMSNPENTICEYDVLMGSLGYSCLCLNNYEIRYRSAFNIEFTPRCWEDVSIDDICQQDWGDHQFWCEWDHGLVFITYDFKSRVSNVYILRSWTIWDRIRWEVMRENREKWSEEAFIKEIPQNQRQLLRVALDLSEVRGEG